MESRSELQMVPDNTMPLGISRFWRGVLSVLFVLWEVGFQVSLQQGKWNATPNWLVFLFMAVPVIGVLVVTLAHPWTRNYYRTNRKKCIIGGLLASLVLLVVLRGMYRQAYAEPPDKVPAKAAAFPQFSSDTQRVEKVSTSAVLPTAASITIGGDNKGNNAIVQNSPGAQVKQTVNLGPQPRVTLSRVLTLNEPVSFQNQPAFKTTIWYHLHSA